MNRLKELEELMQEAERLRGKVRNATNAIKHQADIPDAFFYNIEKEYKQIRELLNIAASNSVRDDSVIMPCHMAVSYIRKLPFSMYRSSPHEYKMAMLLDDFYSAFCEIRNYKKEEQ